MKLIHLPLVDAHIHLEQYAADELEAMLEQSFNGGVAAVVAVSMDLDSAERTRKLAGRHPGRIMPAYGWHPEQELPDEAEMQALLAWIRNRHEAGEAFAIGEVGLPYYMRTEAQAEGKGFDESGYLRILREFVSLAADTGRPIILHAVYEDAAKAAELLREFGVARAHFHWYKGDEAMTRMLADAGWYVSLTPDVLYEEEIRLLAATYPLERLMTETDGPWPFEGPFAGQATHPLMIRESVREIARLRGMDEREAASMLAANARRLYFS
ncbi:TatD family hydrolase [Paenibacillus sp. P22]|uniref:TatD family hydrolase n=1 Tax=Paenibacillus sp. P22 TaxID=483908 RepID=UPI000426D235|nr:TatD family hydrolase [Paenibacillus sp. P22]